MEHIPDCNIYKDLSDIGHQNSGDAAGAPSLPRPLRSLSDVVPLTGPQEGDGRGHAATVSTRRHAPSAALVSITPTRAPWNIGLWQGYRIPEFLMRCLLAPPSASASPDADRSPPLGPADDQIDRGRISALERDRGSLRRARREARAGQERRQLSSAGAAGNGQLAAAAMRIGWMTGLSRSL